MVDVDEKLTFVYEPDLQNASDMMTRSWAPPCWNWDVDLLKLHILRPTGDPSFSGGYQMPSGKLISYVAYIPFRVLYNNKDLNIAYGTFFTVSPEYRGTGIAQSTQGKLLTNLIESSYDLLFVLIEDGSASNRAFAKVCHAIGIDFRIIHSFNYLSSPFALIQNNISQGHSKNTRLFTEHDIDKAYLLLKNLGNNTSLRKVIPRKDIDFVLRTRPKIKTYVFEKNDELIGLVNLLLLEVFDTTQKSLNVYFENVAIDRLSEDEQILFIADIFRYLLDKDISAAFLPDIGYAETKPFKKFNFRLAPRRLHLYAARLKKTIFADGIPEIDSFFLDVF